MCRGFVLYFNCVVVVGKCFVCDLVVCVCFVSVLLNK